MEALLKQFGEKWAWKLTPAILGVPLLVRIGGQVVGLTPSDGERPDIAPERVSVKLFGGHEITGLLEVGKLIAVDEGGFEP